MTVPRSAWKPGQSGNPGGRPKEVGHVRELARRHTPEAIETLAAIMRTSKSDTSRVAAAQALLDRAWGHPTVSLSGADGGGPVEHAVHFYCQRTAGTGRSRRLSGRRPVPAGIAGG